MIEVFNIIYFLFIFLLFSQFGLLQIKNNSKIKLTFFDINQLSFYFLILLNFIFLSSIFNLSKKFFFYFLLIFSLFFILNSIIKNKNKFIINTNKLLILLFFIIFLLLSFQISHDLFFSHDVRLFWFEKVLLFYNDMFVTDDQTIKPEYPHFGTYLWSFFWINSPLDIEYFGRLVYLFVYLLSIFLVVEKIKFKSIFSKGIALIIIILLTFQIKFFDGRQDILIFSFNLFIFSYLYEILNSKSKDKKNYIGFLLSANLILWTKTEGILYILIYMALCLLFFEKKIKNLCFIVLLFIFSQKYIFYIFFDLSLNPSKGMFDANIINYLFDLDLFYRTYQIFFWFFLNIIRNPIFLFCLFIMIYLTILKYEFVRKFMYLYFIFSLLLIGIYLTYLPTKAEFPFAMIGGLDRVILQFSSIFLIPVLKFLELKKII